MTRRGRLPNFPPPGPRLPVERALAMVPPLEGLLPLREAIVEAATPDRGRGRAAAEEYALLETRAVAIEAVRARVRTLAERERLRTERLCEAVVRSLEAVAQRDGAGAARALVEAGELEEEAGRLASAEAFFLRAREEGGTARDRTAEALALRRLGRLRRARGRLDPAEHDYREALAISEALGDREGSVIACQGLGNVAGDRGLWPEAEAWYRRGLELLTDSGPDRLLWQLQSNLSAVARRGDRLAESEGWLQAARDTVAALGDGAGLVYVDNAEGLLRVAQARLQEAEVAYRRALEAATSPAERATVMINLAECLVASQRLEESERALRELEELCLLHGLHPLLVYAYRGLGQIAIARGDEEGFLFFEQALELGRWHDLPPAEEGQTQEQYAALEGRLGRAEAARARIEEAARAYQRGGLAREGARVLAQLDARAANEEPTSGDGE